MAEKVVKEVAKKGASKIAPKVVGMAGTAATAAVSVATHFAQEANNRIIVQLNTDRHNKKDEYVKQRANKQNSIRPKQDELKQTQKDLTDKTNAIKEAQKRILTFENISNDANAKFIVGLGMTGDGKSTVLNRLYGDDSDFGDEGPFPANDSEESVTQKPKHQKVVINEIQTVIVDTPGYKDSDNKEEEHFNNLAAYLYGCKGVNAFLLVMNGTKNRFDGTIQEMLAEYSKYFGPKFWRHLIIIQTHIEAFTKKRYIDHDKADKLKQKMRDKIEGIDEKCELPVITIGFGENLAAFRKDVTNEVVRISNSHSKLLCTNIESPIKKLKAEKQELIEKINHLKNEIKPIQQEINRINKNISELDNKINNPERIPLLTNPRGKI